MNATAIGEVASPCTHSQWHLRYDRAADLYHRTLFSPELLDALAAGLREWASLLPQTELDWHGRHKPVNSWGLGPELSALRTMQAILSVQGEACIAAEIHGLTEQLLKAAMHLDECYPKLSAHEEAAERRLVATCRVQAKGLTLVLERLKKTLFGVGPSARNGTDPLAPPGAKTPRVRKRASRATNIATLRAELVEYIKGTKNAIETAVSLKRPIPGARPVTWAELAQRTGLNRHAVSRCFHDDAAQELRLLWEVANDPELILKYR